MSPPSREAWIEMLYGKFGTNPMRSPPSREAWIEILNKFNYSMVKVSPPSREAWIEIKTIAICNCVCYVASLTGGVD